MCLSLLIYHVINFNKPYCFTWKLENVTMYTYNQSNHLVTHTFLSQLNTRKQRNHFLNSPAVITMGYRTTLKEEGAFFPAEQRQKVQPWPLSSYNKRR